MVHVQFTASQYLREQKSGFSMENDMMHTLPIWIKLPNLLFHLWDLVVWAKLCFGVDL